MRWIHTNKNAGCLNKKTGYYVVRLKDKLYQSHRLIWVLHNNTIKSDLVIDHIDRNRSNNIITNLRLVTKQTNNFNKQNLTSTPGVIWQGKDKKLFASAIWREDDIRKSKSFSVNKYGKEVAWNLALQYRQTILKELFHGV